MNNMTNIRIPPDSTAAWEELEAALTKIEKNAFGQLTDRDLIALPSLYRNAMSSLARARATLTDDALREYLEGLCRRAYFLIYGIDETLSSRAARFVHHDWRQTIRDLQPEFLISFSLIVLGFIAG